MLLEEPNIFKNKYLKYKRKYLNIKMNGGNPSTDNFIFMFDNILWNIKDNRSKKKNKINNYKSINELPKTFKFKENIERIVIST
jgi:hypothetical protein